MTNMTQSYLIFPSGPTVPGLPAPTPYNLDESEQPYNAAQQVNVGPGYAFEFWDINAQLYFANTLTAPVPSNPFSATAWYFTDGGTPTKDVYTFAFSVDLNQWFSQTPVDTVNGAPWDSPSTVVPTTGNVVITAKPQIAGYGEFIGWFQAGSGLNPSPTLTVAAGSDIQAIAFYQHVGAITGTIQEDTDGGMFDLSGAVITATPGGQTKSNRGTYVLSGLRPGPVQLSAVFPHATQFNANLTVVADQTITQDIVLTRLGTTV
jgi:hypothetical protein